MVQKTNSLGGFWKELKRRKVFGVVTTYAATAYIIVEVTNNIIDSLVLPDWIGQIIVLLLIACLPVVAVLAWIFDFTPKGIEKTVSISESRSKETVTKPVRIKLRASYILNSILIIVVIILAYPRIFKKNSLERLRSSGRMTIVVVPFQNMTNDGSKDYWEEMIPDNIMTSLANSEDIQVRHSESVTNLLQDNKITNYSAITPSVARIVSQKLEADVLILGSINQSDDNIRINAKLIDPQSEVVLKSFQLNGITENILQITDSLSVRIMNFLVLSELEKEIPEVYNLSGMTNSPEAYSYFIQGRNEYSKENYQIALDWLSKAIAVDSGFFQAMIMASLAYRNMYEYATWFSSAYDKISLYGEAKKWCLKAYSKIDQMTIRQKIEVKWLYASLFETKNEEINYLKQLIGYDDQLVTAYYKLGNAYHESTQYDNAIAEYEKALEIYERWGLKPYWVFYYTYLGQMYHKTGQYRKEEKIYEKASKDFPDDPELIGWQAIVTLTQGDTVASRQYFEKLTTILKNMSVPEAIIMELLAFGYNEAGYPDMSEKYYRLSFSLGPDNPDIINNLAYFLIDNDRNVSEGVELIEKILELNPDNFVFLHTKGWGLYKQGRYREALEMLQKSWNLRREMAVYDHTAFLHLEAAKKAASGMK